MTTTAGTAASDVRVEIETELTDSEIDDILGRVERDIDREYSTGTDDFDSTQHRVDFEAAVAAYRIGTGRDPRMQRESVGNVTLDTDGSPVAALKRRVTLLDPGGAFPADALKRDTDRRIGSAGGG